MDKARQFRIDSIEATDKTPSPSLEKTRAPMPFQSYQLAAIGETPMAIDFRCLDGSRFGIAYSYLQKVEYNPDPVNEAVALQFSVGEVTIKGVNLEFIYENLLKKRLVWIREVNTQLLDRYQELRPVNDNLKEGVPVVVDIDYSAKP
tara:strand:+ start:781 stop:1221 length:441 start_codon:yes stop_codon:yes gene_type:complete